MANPSFAAMSKQSQSKQPLLSLELERVLAYRSECKSIQQQVTKPLEMPTHATIQALWNSLIDIGWKPARDLHTNIVTKVIKDYKSRHYLHQFWSCYTDIVTGSFETTLAPCITLSELDAQQTALDRELASILWGLNLKVFNFGTFPAIVLDRETFNLHYTYWTGGNQLLFQRGMNLQALGSILASQPSLSLESHNAIEFFRVVQRLAGISIILTRFESISNRDVTPDGLLSLRERTANILWKNSPYPSDRLRAGMLSREVHNWKEYLDFLMGLPLIGVGDNKLTKRVRIVGDPTFYDYWHHTPKEGWQAVFPDGRWVQIKIPRFRDFSCLDDQIQLTRLRWKFRKIASLKELDTAYKLGNNAIIQWMEENVESLYIEIRNDSCGSPGQEFAMLALYTGLLANLEKSYSFVVNQYPYSFWKRIYTTSSSCLVRTKVMGVWIPDIIQKLIDIALEGIKRRGYQEEKYIKPLVQQLEQKSSPAEQALKIFLAERDTQKGLEALASRYQCQSSGKSFT